MSGDARLPRGPRGIQGERGARGAQGERGEALSPKVRRAFALLFVLTFLLSGLCLLFTAHYVNATQAAQRRQGQVFEQKICTTFARLAKQTPPPGNAAANPSRAYLQNQHAVLAELGPDIGCPKGTP